MQHSNCSCALIALQTLARVEEFTTSSRMPLDVVLQVTYAAEKPSLAVLNCEMCRQQRLSLTAVTILCTHLVDWLCRVWNLNYEEAAASSTIATTLATPPTTNTTTTTASFNASKSTENQSTTQQGTGFATRPWKFSLGSYDVATDEADALSNEMMSLRLTSLCTVLGSLEAALVSSGPAFPKSASSGDGVSGTSSDKASSAPAYLDLVRANIRLLRACVNRLKAHSLTHSGTVRAL